MGRTVLPSCAWNKVYGFGLALHVKDGIFGCFHQNGTKPQRALRISIDDRDLRGRCDIRTTRPVQHGLTARAVSHWLREDSCAANKPSAQISNSTPISIIWALGILK